WVTVRSPFSLSWRCLSDSSCRSSSLIMLATSDEISSSERWLPVWLSAIAGMVDVIGFLSLGIFTAHVTGNIVVVAALIVRHVRVNPAQILAVPVFVFAVVATWLVARASGRRGLGLMRLLLL